MIKDHKKIEPGDLPKTRPVVSNCRGMGVHLSNMVSEIVEALANSLDEDFEVISTEDAKSKLNDYNELGGCRLSEGDLRMLIGADAVALFPSLDTTQVARLVAEE